MNHHVETLLGLFLLVCGTADCGSTVKAREPAVASTPAQPAEVASGLAVSVNLDNCAEGKFQPDDHDLVYLTCKVSDSVNPLIGIIWVRSSWVRVTSEQRH